MKISDNLLRTIRYGYTSTSKTVFIVKANLLDLSDNSEIIAKALETVDMLVSTTEYIETPTEKQFYDFKLTVEMYNKLIGKEDKKDKTVRQYLSNHGLVHSEFIEYMYLSLTSCQPSTINKEAVLKSLETTHNQLIKITSTLEKPVSNADMNSIFTEMNNMKKQTMDIRKKMTNNLPNPQDISKVIQKAKTNINDMLESITNPQVNLQENQTIESQNSLDFTEYTEKITSIIDDRVKQSLEKYNECLISTLENKVDEYYEVHLKELIENSLKDKIDDVLFTLNNKVQLEINNYRIKESVDKEADDMIKSMRELTAKLEKVQDKNKLAELDAELNALTVATGAMIDSNNQFTDSIQSNINKMNQRNLTSNTKQKSLATYKVPVGDANAYSVFKKAGEALGYTKEEIDEHYRNYSLPILDELAKWAMAGVIIANPNPIPQISKKDMELEFY